MQWSSEQEHIFEVFQKDTCNILVNAAPGSGKTTTIEEIWKRSTEPTVYLAFNNPIVQEAKARLPSKVGSDVLTLNSLGHRAVMKAFPGITLDKDKVFKLIKSLCRFDKKDYSKNMSALLKLIQFMKSELGSDNERGIWALIEQYELDSYAEIVPDALKVYRASLEDRSTIDYNDQLLWPVYYGLALPQYSLMLGDEVQDFNSIQAKLVSQLECERYVLVGDRHQSIYAFRGALSNSMDYLTEHFACQVMPMTLTYRCPRTVVAKAQEYWPDDIQAREDAPEGSIRSLSKYDCYQQGELLLCRAMAPLADKALELLRDNVPCQLKGRDIGQNLTRYIERVIGEESSLVKAMSLVESDIEHSVELAKQRDDTEKIEKLLDRRETIRAFAEGCGVKTLEGLKQHIAGMFENGKGILLSTVHRAKGLEAQKVYLLEFGRFERVLAYGQALVKQRRISQEKLDQGKNIAYVAVTRSKDALVYC